MSSSLLHLCYCKTSSEKEELKILTVSMWITIIIQPRKGNWQPHKAELQKLNVCVVTYMCTVYDWFPAIRILCCDVMVKICSVLHDCKYTIWSCVQETVQIKIGGVTCSTLSDSSFSSLAWLSGFCWLHLQILFIYVRPINLLLEHKLAIHLR